MVTHYPLSNHVAVATDRCPDCNSRDLIEDNSRSELYCNQCGTVLVENFSRDDKDKKSNDDDLETAIFRSWCVRCQVGFGGAA